MHCFSVRFCNSCCDTEVDNIFFILSGDWVLQVLLTEVLWRKQRQGLWPLWPFTLDIILRNKANLSMWGFFLSEKESESMISLFCLWYYMCKQILHCNKYLFLPTEGSPCGTRIRTIFKTFFLLRVYLVFTYSVFHLSYPWQKCCICFYTGLWLVVLTVFVSCRVAFNVFTDG